ncbi:hypothetical protein QNM99_08275 [Pseudomonas sp. PCH446]
MRSLSAIPWYALAIFVAIVLFIEIGRRIGARHLASTPRARGPGSAPSKVRSSACWPC